MDLTNDFYPETWCPVSNLELDTWLGMNQISSPEDMCAVLADNNCMYIICANLHIMKVVNVTDGSVTTHQLPLWERLRQGHVGWSSGALGHDGFI